MRVMWVSDFVSVTLQEVATRLARRPHIELSLVGSSEIPGISNTPLVCKSKLDFQARRIIRDSLRSVQPDLVFAYTSRNLANTIGACRGLKSAPQLIGYRGTINRLHRLDPANWITFWHPRVNKIVCVCHATERALIDSGISPAKLTTIWEGCDSNLLPKVDRSALQQFDIPQDAFVVGTVANMRPVKGVDLLLEAASRLRDLNIYWLLIGDVRDPRVTKLAVAPEIRDRVRLPGARPGGGRFTRLFDIYVAPSRMEGLSMGIMEAMVQSSCPVVTDVGGSSELIRNEVDGLVVPPENVAALADAIRRLHGDASCRRRFAESARRRGESEFSIESWAARHDTLYQELMHGAAAEAA